MKRKKITSIRPDIFELESLLDETDYIKIILLGIITSAIIFVIILSL